MNQSAFNCALCSLLDSSKGNKLVLSGLSEAKIHARIHIGQVKMFEDGQIDEEQMFERCFPKSPMQMRQGRRSLFDLCRSLFDKRPKVSDIACNLCGSSINIVDHGKFFTADRIVAHACIHVGVKPVKCRHCEKSFRNRANVWQHFKPAHGTKLTNQDFEDQSEKFHDEISNSIKRCFTKCKEGVTSKERRDLTRDAIAARSGRMTNASELAVQRQVFFNRIIKQSANADGNVKCRLCSKTIKAKRSVKSGEGPIVMSPNHHAQCHLRKPLYRCSICKEALNTYEIMKTHLKAKHSLGMEHNHECFADKFHLDILAIFAQCYEKGESSV